ncbi:hypothetical protein LMG9673_03336 [Ralstonia pseudosolanacearum]|nr:hypothetical protein [Ralstonia pseudosolanacearum]UWD88616.1 hypothetical protein NY025_00270 [Ralstonia pseudosolanacearum]CAH0442521.1 hypothetical protein LMG9673_03336 [Ralstonia pseudosolanacearum]
MATSKGTPSKKRATQPARPAATATPAASTAAATAATAPAASLNIAAINLARIPLTIDPLGQQGSKLTSTLQPFRTEAITKVYLGLQQIQANLQNVTQALAQPQIPTTLVGALQQPDGTHASVVQIQFTPSSVGGNGQPVTVITADDGGFTLQLPSNLTLPSTGIPLTVHGANGNAQVTIPAAQVASNGLVGAITLPSTLTPLPVSILGALKALVPTTTTTPGAPPSPANPPQFPTVKLGESGDCMLQFGANNTVDTFPYGVFFRLVEPRLSIVQKIIRHPLGAGDANTFLPMPVYATQYGAGNSTQTSYADRTPVEQPLSADGFRDQIMGLGTNGLFTADETVPMAATLGLGYVLWMSQQWTFQGVGLGDLVYSLPLAPGEQQQMAVFERLDTTSVTESEFFSEEQAQQQRALADTSTAATFNSAFSEAARGGSAFQTSSTTSSWGANILIASGGGGNSSSAGASSSWLQGQRDSTEQAAQTTHSAAENQASARRTAARTGMRMATASELQSVTTKTVTNHNHAHALTMQYWEVLRLYNVTAAIDGLTLVCLIPMQIVRFMPPGQLQTITDPSTLSTRAQVLARYSALVKHLDILAQAIPRAYRHGLTLLQQFAADPAAGVEPFGGVAEDVILFNLTGNFLCCENISIAVVTDRNTRVGPVRLANTATKLPDDIFLSSDDLLAWLGAQRQQPSTFTGALALPPSMNRSSVIGFEITRSFRQVDYTLISAEMAELNALTKLFGGSGTTWATQAIQSTLGADAASNTRTTVHLKPADLENALGGPMLFNFYAQIQELDANGNPQPPTKGETYANDSLYGVELPPQPYPVPALQLAPVLRFNEILEIEQTAQHVLRNTTLYSKAIWASLSTEERAILLDQYTIGVSPGGITDESQMVPLLNCVQNRLLGFFGNSMVMPFIIPQAVAEEMRIDPVQIQQSLLAYQQATFAPPQSTVALPTRGVLGEAVLGHCASAEKIDLLRFWNWQDSPSDAAPVISPVTLPTTTPSMAAGLTAPNSLTTLPSLINNVLTAPSPDMSLLTALGKDATSQPDFSTALTGATQLAGLLTNAQNVSNAARADALKNATTLQSQAMATVGNILGGIYGGNPTAGSSAAAAVNGTGSGGGGSASSTGTKPGTGTGTGSTPTKPPAGTGTGTGTGTGAGAGAGAGAGRGS